MSSHPSSVSRRSIVLVGGGAPPTTMRTLPGRHDPPGWFAAAVKISAHDRGRAAHEGHAMVLDATEDLEAVDLAQDDVAATHPGDRVHHAPAVAVEHRHRPQVDVAVVDAGVPSQRQRVDVKVAMRELDALRSGRRAARVVDRGGRVLTAVPQARACGRSAAADGRSLRPGRGEWARARPRAPRRAPGRRATSTRPSARRCSAPLRRSDGS